MEKCGISNPRDAIHAEFEALRQLLSSSEWRHKRGHRKAHFTQMLHIIREFNERPDGHGPLRSQLTGVCHFPAAVAYDISRLDEWIGKLKYSLNRSLKMLGYAPARVDDCSYLFDELRTKIPSLRTQTPAANIWTPSRTAPTTHKSALRTLSQRLQRQPAPASPTERTTVKV
jgi:hypothetical protein